MESKDYRIIAEYWGDEYERYTRAIADGTLPYIDRVLPTARVCWSDLVSHFPELTKIDPSERLDIERALRRVAKRRKFADWLAATKRR